MLLVVVVVVVTTTTTIIIIIIIPVGRVFSVWFVTRLYNEDQLPL
jgi:hypothetical protein